VTGWDLGALGGLVARQWRRSSRTASSTSTSMRSLGRPAARFTAPDEVVRDGVGPVASRVRQSAPQSCCAGLIPSRSAGSVCCALGLPASRVRQRTRARSPSRGVSICSRRGSDAGPLVRTWRRGADGQRSRSAMPVTSAASMALACRTGPSASARVAWRRCPGCSREWRVGLAFRSVRRGQGEPGRPCGPCAHRDLGSIG
jgi:hypothetical protein